MRKKIMSLLLVAIMMFSLVPTSAFADTTVTVKHTGATQYGSTMCGVFEVDGVRGYCLQHECPSTGEWKGTKDVIIPTKTDTKQQSNCSTKVSTISPKIRCGNCIATC